MPAIAPAEDDVTVRAAGRLEHHSFLRADGSIIALLYAPDGARAELELHTPARTAWSYALDGAAAHPPISAARLPPLELAPGAIAILRFDQ